jgi:putative hydrolase of the HAD superfamily
MIRAVVFDFGDTLVQFYTREQFPQVLQSAMDQCSSVLLRSGMSCPSPGEVMRRAKLENFEAKDHSTRPLEDRLMRIFGLENEPDGDLMDYLCGAFLVPIASLARCYDDTESSVQDIKAMGLKTAILTNNPWGMPARTWKELMMRYSFASAVDKIVCCRDVGWRKPSRQPFDRVVQELRVHPDEAIMVGDSFDLDVRGATAAGLLAVHLDRHSPAAAHHELVGGQYRIGSLRELAGLIEAASKKLL